MKRLIKVAQNEFREMVWRKTFLLAALGPLLLVGVILHFTKATVKGPRGQQPPRRVAVLDRSGRLAGRLGEMVDQHNASHPQAQLRLIADAGGDPNESDRRYQQEIRQGQLDFYVQAGEGFPLESKSVTIYGRQSRAADMAAGAAVEGLVNRAAFEWRCEQEGISPQLVNRLRSQVTHWVEIDTQTGEQRKRSEADMVTGMMVPFFFLFMMFMAVMSMGQHLLSSVIEEKSSRVMEVLLSAVSPFELMAGKILGLAGAGLLVVGLWTGSAFAAAHWRGLAIDVPPSMLGYFVAYYVLGFLLTTALLVGIGSVCNNIKEAQSLVLPVNLLMVLPMMIWYNLAQNPNGTLAVALSFVPPTTPMIMILRLGSGAPIPAWQIVATFGLLVASVPAAFYLAAKIFRTGILLYGKRPTLGQLMQCLRQR